MIKPIEKIYPVVYQSKQLVAAGNIKKKNGKKVEFKLILEECLNEKND